MKIAEKNLELLKDLSPELGEIMEGMLKGVVIYTEDKGIFLLRDYKIDGNKIEYEGVMSSVKNDIFEALKGSKSITIVDKNHIKTKSKELKGSDIGVIVFT